MTYIGILSLIWQTISRDEIDLRKNQIWFCLTRNLVLDSGTEDFFKYFGGEAVYGAFLEDKRVLSVLEKIGEPVVVEAKIDMAKLKVTGGAIGRTLVSHFMHSHNPNFRVEDSEGFVFVDIPPSSIIAVHPHNEFIEML